VPFLDHQHVRELLIDARDARRSYPCHTVISLPCLCARDYCRQCDKFYWIHQAGCENEVREHDGHRLTIVPFVEEKWECCSKLQERGC